MERPDSFRLSLKSVIPKFLQKIALDTVAKNPDNSALIFTITELRKITMPQSAQVSIGVLLCLLFVAGCHTPLAIKQMQAKNSLARNAPKTPVKMVDVWNSYAQARPDGTIMRGMAGRVHFYDNHRGDRAVKVDGDVTVIIFDGNETDPAYTRPLKVFQFRADTLDQHHSHQQPFGHGYNFFLPMDEIGGIEKPISIIVRFDNHLDDKFIITQQPVNTVLAGRRAEHPTDPSIREFLDSRSLLAETNRSITTAHNASAIQQVAHITETTATVEPERPRSSTIIPLNRGMTRRLHSTATLDEPTLDVPLNRGMTQRLQSLHSTTTLDVPTLGVP